MPSPATIVEAAVSAIDGTTLLILAGLLIAVWLVWTEPKEDR